MIKNSFNNQHVVSGESSKEKIIKDTIRDSKYERRASIGSTPVNEVVIMKSLLKSDIIENKAHISWLFNTHTIVVGYPI